jgi:putative Mg2+ transporter-C (MgtC) family protein
VFDFVKARAPDSRELYKAFPKSYNHYKFIDLGDSRFDSSVSMAINSDDLIKILLAIVLGGAIGIERELHHKAAGFRTIILICMGATLVTIIDERAQAQGRMMANVITGIGFLGAGVILRDTNRIKGLTTAAAVWLAAVLGICIGYGAYLLSGVAVLVVLFIMRVFVRVERVVEDAWDLRQYEVILPCDFQKKAQIENLMHNNGLSVRADEQMKRGGNMVCYWEVSGSIKKQNAFVRQALDDPDVVEITW